MSKVSEQIGDKIWLGVVVDNNDPMKIGRCRVRVRYIFDEIPDGDIPWAHPKRRADGKAHAKPDIGKVVSVQFFAGDIYSPEYDAAEHYSIDLQKLMEKVDYDTFVALHVDADTQIWATEKDGLTIDHAKSKMVINKDGDISHELRDGNSKLLLGTEKADESAILGDKFMEELNILLTAFATPGAYLTGAGLPVVPGPDLITKMANFRTAKLNFLSRHIKLAKNGDIKNLRRDSDGSEGDNWNMINSEKEITFVTETKPSYEPVPVEVVKAKLEEENKKIIEAETAVSEEEFDLVTVDYNAPFTSFTEDEELSASNVEASTIKPSTIKPSTSQKENIKLVNDALIKYGFKNSYLRAGILSVVNKETLFMPVSEITYSTTSNDRIRQIWPAKFKEMPDAQLTALKKNDKKFFSFVYNGIIGNRPGTEDGWTYRGRGFNGLTGRGNYVDMGTKIGKSLVTNPDLVNDTKVAAEVLAAFFLNSFNYGKTSGLLKSRYGVSSQDGVNSTKLGATIAHQSNMGWGKIPAQDTTGAFITTLAKVDYFYKNYTNV